MILDREQSCLVVIDVQQRLTPAMHEPDTMIDNCAVLMRAASRLGVPTLVSEQYPKGLGATVPQLAELADAATIIDKVHFSCAADDRCRGWIEEAGRPQVVICGIESHVCVTQTALGLSDAGYGCAVVADAVSSRDPANRALALERLRANGVEIVATEMVLFEWLESAQDPAFKDVSALIK